MSLKKPLLSYKSIQGTQLHKKPSEYLIEEESFKIEN